MYIFIWSRNCYFLIIFNQKITCCHSDLSKEPRTSDSDYYTVLRLGHNCFSWLRENKWTKYAAQKNDIQSLTPPCPCEEKQEDISYMLPESCF